MLAIRLPEDIENCLTNLAKLTGRTKSFYARQAIEQHPDDLEDIDLADQRLTDSHAGLTQPIPLEKVLKDFGLED